MKLASNAVAPSPSDFEQSVAIKQNNNAASSCGQRGEPLLLCRRSEKWSAALLPITSKLRAIKSFKTLRDMKADTEIDYGTLEQIKLLGTGAFGSVHLCHYTVEGKGTPVAVKQMKAEAATDTNSMGQFQAECRLMVKLRHRNIVDFVGSGVRQQGGQQELFLVQEYCNADSLHKKLERQMRRGTTRLKEYTLLQVLEWLKDITRGLSYLHEASPPVVHRDMKLENVLLHKMGGGGKEEAKIADFGLASVLKKERMDRRLAEQALAGGSSSWGVSKTAAHDSPTQPQMQTGVVGRLASTLLARSMNFVRSAKFELTGQTGSLMYMAPEVYKQLPYNEKADIFAVGVIAFELFSGYSMICLVSHAGHPREIRDHAERTSAGERKNIPNVWPPEVGELISSLWAQDPDHRPTARAAMTSLQSMGHVFQQWQQEMSSGCLGCL